MPPKIPPADADRLRKALNSDYETLLAELGAFGLDAAPRDAVEKGLRRYKALAKRLEKRVCTDDSVRRLIVDRADGVVLAAAIADLVASVSHQAPAATVAALLVKNGLTDYCRSYWS